MSKIHPKKLVKSYRYGNTLEITTGHGSKRQTIKVISNKRYINLETGEIKPFKETANTRLSNIDAVKRTMKKLRRLISHNFNGGKKELWITLTYSRHVTDSKIAYRDFKIFIKNIRKKYISVEYISVIEPQASGRWHFHVLIKDKQPLYIANSEIQQAWGRGFTKTKRLKSSDKVANYVVSYLSNLPLNSIDLIDSQKSSKQVIKGGRLYLYPKGLRIYRCSKGISHPVELTGRKELILMKNDVLVDQVPNFSKTTKYSNQNIEIEYTTEFFDDIQSIQKEDVTMPRTANDDTSKR